VNQDEIVQDDCAGRFVKEDDLFNEPVAREEAKKGGINIR
jgi:hypothetical protein